MFSMAYLRDRFAAIFRTGVVTVWARLASLLVFALAARTLTTQDNASVIYMVAVANLIVQLGSLGWLNLTRRIAARFEYERPGLVNGFIARSFQIPGAIVVVVCIAVIGTSQFQWVAEGLGKTLFYTGLAALPLLVSSIQREYLIAFSRPALAILLSEALPFTLILGAFLLLRVNALPEAAGVIICAWTLACALQAAALRGLFAQRRTAERKEYDTKVWMKVAFITSIGYGSRLLMDRIDALLLVPLIGLEQIAFYNSASRLANLLLLAPTVLIPVFSSRVAKAYAERNIRQLRIEVSLQVAIIVASALPFVALLLIAPGQILGLVFGQTYVASAHLMLPLVLAQLLFALSLPFSNLLLMTNGEKKYALLSFFALLVNLAISWITIPMHLAAGAAYSAAIANMLLALALLVACRKYLVMKSGPL